MSRVSLPLNELLRMYVMVHPQVDEKKQEARDIRECYKNVARAGTSGKPAYYTVGRYYYAK